MITRVKALNFALTVVVAGQQLRAKSYEVRDDGTRRVVLTEGDCLTEQAIIVSAATDFACLPDAIDHSTQLRVPRLNEENVC